MNEICNTKYASEFFVLDDKLWRKDRHRKHKIVIPKEKGLYLVRQAHNKLGHKGIFTTQIQLLLFEGMATVPNPCSFHCIYVLFINTFFFQPISYVSRTLLSFTKGPIYKSTILSACTDV